MSSIEGLEVAGVGRGVGKCPTRLDGARLVPFTAQPPPFITQSVHSYLSQVFKADLKFQSGRPRHEGGGRRGRSGGRSVL